MDERYDVIIIGSGAGGGTLAHRLAPSGKKILILERGDWLPREAAQLERRGRLRRQPLRLAGDLADCRTGSRSSRRCIISSAARPRCSARRSIACARRISASCSITTASRRPGRSVTTRLEPYYTRGRTALSGAWRARPRSDRAAGQRALSGAAGVATSRASQKLTDDLTAAGYHPFPAPAAVMLNEADMAYSRCIRCQTCDGFPCLVHAKSDAEVIAVRPALEHPNVTLLRNARALKLETNAGGHARSPACVAEVARRAASVSRPTSSWSPAARRIRPRCCCARRTTGIRPGSPTAPVRSGGTTCSTTARRCWRCR